MNYNNNEQNSIVDALQKYNKQAMMTTENENLKNSNQQLTIQLNAYKDKEDVKAAQDKEMFKIFIEGFKERQEININKNLTINNIKAFIGQEY